MKKIQASLLITTLLLCTAITFGMEQQTNATSNLQEDKIQQLIKKSKRHPWKNQPIEEAKIQQLSRHFSPIKESKSHFYAELNEALAAYDAEHKKLLEIEGQIEKLLEMRDKSLGRKSTSPDAL